MLLDKRGRVKFTTHTQKPNRFFNPGLVHFKILKFINLHGPLSSEIIGEYLGTNRHNVREHIKNAFDGQLLYRPIEQTYNTNFPTRNFHVYDLTEKGRKLLEDSGHLFDSRKPSSSDAADKWWHQHMIATITATIHLCCDREGYRYIPPHEILKGAKIGHLVPFKWAEKELISTVKLTPDAVFAIDYGGSRVLYCLEADRNTETRAPKTWDRKSDLRSIKQYANFFEKKLYQKAYGVDYPVYLLFVTVSESHKYNFIDQVREELGESKEITAASIEGFARPCRSPKLPKLFYDGLPRAGHEPYTVKKK